MRSVNISALLLLASALVAKAEVRVWQGTLTLPTYEEGLPDPNPPFDIFATTRFNYPYTLRDNLIDRRTEHAWRAIFLENEYLKCSVLPDIGGHVYTCVDKISGQPMFYANPSIKKAQIGYRGAWAAFGIEFNFPVSHNWLSMSPVDFAYAEHPDGSASVTVGAMDRVYGMSWSVELVLRPNSALLEEKVTLNNPSDVRHRFYWWNNAAVEAWDDSRIEYPMRFAASHGFTEVQTWPIDSDGTDLSIVRNQTKGPVSLFVHGSREPFMGVWHPKTNTGVVHFAGYGQLPGKKIWSWGVDADGLDWRKALSDNNSAYVEVQAGLFRNQETYAFLEPCQTIRFSEYWMPVRQIGGIARANLNGVVNLSRRGGALVAALNVNRPIASASIRELDGSRIAFEQTADLTPEHVWTHELALSDAAKKYTFELRDASAGILLRHTEGEYDWDPKEKVRVGPQPSYRMTETGKRTDDEWLQVGKDQELNGKLLAALDTYQQGLTRYPGSFGLQKAAGRLSAGSLRFEEAVRYLEPVYARDTSDPEISYYLGIAYEGAGNLRAAQNAYEAAQRMPQFRSAGAVRLAELMACKGNLSEAVRYIDEALNGSADDVRIAEEWVILHRVLGDKQVASLARFPLSYVLAEELEKPDLAHLAGDANRVLEIASTYMRLGQYRSALAVLSRTYPEAPTDQVEPGAIAPDRHPLVAYFRAYSKEKLGEPAGDEYAAASRLPAQYVFPSGYQTLEVLRAAVRSNPNDARAHYLLGTLYFSIGLTDPALEHWEQARTKNPNIPVLAASVGLALLHLKHDPQRALDAFREGLTADPRNPRIYEGMDQALGVLKRPASERVQALQHYPDLSHMPTPLVYELALNRAEANDFEGASALFRNRFFPREEGGTNVREVWVEVRLLQALSLARAGQCEGALSLGQQIASRVPGLDFTNDGLEPMASSARTQYLLGTLDSNCGRAEEAASRFARAAGNRTEELYWAYAAAKKQHGFSEASWREKLEAALARAKANNEAGFTTSSRAYSMGLLELALGHPKAADQAFQQALLLPDRNLAHHLSRLMRDGHY